MFIFHTPETPEPLDLDLAELDGGGGNPAQFYGKTHDGREVYVRYRWGTLTVDIALEPGDNALDNGVEALTAIIGDPLDGSMELHEFCELFAVTINGKMPKERSTDQTVNFFNKDQIGETAYWRGDLRGVTEPTSRKILTTCKTTLPNSVLVKPTMVGFRNVIEITEIDPFEASSEKLWLVLGTSNINDLDLHDGQLRTRAGHHKIDLSSSNWKTPSKPRQVFSSLNDAGKELGKTFVIAGDQQGEIESALAYANLDMSTDFETSDRKLRDELSRLGNAISVHFPMTKLEHVNLATNEVESHSTQPLDIVITKWCHENINRWLCITKNHHSGQWVGIRPSRSI